QADRTIIPADQATRTIDLEVTDDGTEPGTSFSVTAIDVSAGETVKLAVKNTGTFSHALRVVGADGKYDTSDDFVSNPDFIEPGATGAVIIRFDSPGQVEFKEPGVAAATGTITVGQAAPTPAPTATATSTAEPVAQTIQLTAADNFYDPAQLQVAAGQRFRITLTNTGTFVHNLRIAGPDGQFRTDDDLISSTDVKGGETGELVGQIDTPGDYPFQDDFHPTEMKGTITVQ
ncbi:MAG TPA: cupredoxin domain-containing protein, partial [Dehalococcoidia bacterium]|nr:cupredoxin domain-containing protein [Dehalococcoidia bacterium]